MTTVHIEIIDIYMDNVFMYFGDTKYSKNSKRRYTTMRRIHISGDMGKKIIVIDSKNTYVISIRSVTQSTSVIE